jgi:hypothetical protein
MKGREVKTAEWGRAKAAVATYEAAMGQGHMEICCCASFHVGVPYVHASQLLLSRLLFACVAV